MEGINLKRLIDIVCYFNNINKKKFFEMEGINSVEQLAGLSDGACHGLGKDVLDHRKEAKQFLAGEHTKPQQPVVGE